VIADAAARTPPERGLVDPLRRQNDFAAFIGILDTPVAGAFMHGLPDLRFRPPHEALAVRQIFATRVQTAIDYVHRVPVGPLR
jgi:hypothetical protein